MRREVLVGGFALVLALLACGSSCQKAPDTSNQPTDVTPELTTPTPSSGKVALPSGSTLKLTDLRVITNAGEAPVGADGSFTAQVIANTPSLTPLVDTNDVAVLLGFLSAGTNQTIDAKSTADVLLYFALGGTGLPQERLSDLLAGIINSKGETDLAAAISVAIAAEPEALLHGSAAINAAIVTARDEILSTSTTAKELKAVAKSKVRAGVTEDATGPLLTVTPATAQSNLKVEANQDGSGVTVTNTAPRRGALYLLQTGYTDLSGNDVVLPNPEQVQAAVPISKTTSIAQAVHFSQGIPSSTATLWTTSQTPVFLPQRDNSSKTTYDLVVLGAALDQPVPAAFSDPKYVTFRSDCLNQSKELQFDTFIFDFMIPIAETFAVGTRVTLFPIPFFNPGDTRPTLAITLQALVEPILTGAGVSLDTTDGFKNAINAILERAANSVDFRNSLIDALIVSYQDENGQLVSRSFMSGNLNRLSHLDSINSAISSRADLSRLIPTLQGSSKADIWQASVALVQLTPDIPTVTIDEPSAEFTANVQGSPPAPLSYNWSTSGAKGHLATALGKNGMSFDTSENQAQYVAEPGSIVDGTLDTVTVRVTDANGKFVGSATTHVLGSTASPSFCTSFPESAYNVDPRLSLTISPTVVTPGQQISCTVSYTFNGDSTDRGVALWMSNVCGPCFVYKASNGDQNTCICTAADSATVMVNGHSLPGVDHAKFAGDFGKGISPDILPIEMTCLADVGVPFDVPPKDSQGNPFKGTLSTTVVFTVSPDYHGCPPENPQCSCPRQTLNLTISPDISWGGNFVIATEGSDFKKIAVRAYNFAIEQPGARPYCP